MQTKKDPRTGKFTKGNAGRPKGTKNTRTLQWEELGMQGGIIRPKFLDFPKEP